MNDEHVARLYGTVEAWNEWRAQFPSLRPDLSGIVLNMTDLSGANLNATILRGALLHDSYLGGVDLSYADLRGASLINAVLREANLNNANLSDAFLQSAQLQGADLSRADLSRSRLRGAYLDSANLDYTNMNSCDLRDSYLLRTRIHGTKLDEADLANATLGFTTINDVDLLSVLNLDRATHIGPSSISVDTIIRSKGHIPRTFLLGAGVPESFVDYIPSLIVGLQPIQFYSCFISYSTANDDFAHRLHADLQAAHVRCWFAPEDLKIGDRFRQRIEDAIRVYDKLLVVLTDDSVESEWVETEVEGALERERRDPDRRDVLFPIRLDDAVMTTGRAWAGDLRRKRHIGDFTRWKDHDAYKAAFDRLLRDLKASSEAGPGGE